MSKIRKDGFAGEAMEVSHGSKLAECQGARGDVREVQTTGLARFSGSGSRSIVMQVIE